MKKQCINFITILLFYYFTGPINGQKWANVNESLGAVTDIVEQNGKLYTISNLGLFSVSEDKGESWTIKDIRNTSTLENPIFNTIAYFDDHHGIIGIRSNLLTYQLLDTDETDTDWKVLDHEHSDNCNQGLIPLKLNVINDTTAVLVSLNSGELRITRNRGASWECIDNFKGSQSIQKLEIRSENEWYFNDLIGLNYTETGGQKWNTIFKKDLIDFHLFEDTIVYALTPYYDSFDQIPVLYRTIDNFKSYDSIALDMFQGEFIDQFIVIAEDEIYMFSGDKIYFSSDGAQNFDLIQKLDQQPFRISKFMGEWYLSGRGLWKLDRTSSKVKSSSTSQIRVYPNPVTDKINLFDNHYQSYHLISSDGKIIKAGQVLDSSINVYNLISGLYFLQLYDHHTAVVLKLIK